MAITGEEKIMSCVYKVSTEHKKSIIHTEIFWKTIGDVKYEARIEQTWRWGYAIISDVEKDSIDLENPDGLLVSDYIIEDQDLDDGVALWFYYSDNVTDEMKEEFESVWEEDGYSGVEEKDWSMWDTELVFIGPLEVELLEETEDEEDDEPEDTGKTTTPKSTWPF